MGKVHPKGVPFSGLMYTYFTSRSKQKVGEFKTLIEAARCSFFSPRVVVLKINILLEANLRYLSNYTTLIAYAQSLIFCWFHWNKCYHSNDNYFLLFF